jgi:hypothetical protein
MEGNHRQFNNSAVIWVGGVFLAIGFFIGIVVGVYKSDLSPTGQSMSGDVGKAPELKSRIAKLKTLSGKTRMTWKPGLTSEMPVSMQISMKNRSGLIKRRCPSIPAMPMSGPIWG